MPADPKVSEGARLERATMRRHLARLLNDPDERTRWIADKLLTWVKARQQRYDRRPGGLGKA